MEQPVKTHGKNRNQGLSPWTIGLFVVLTGVFFCIGLFYIGPIVGSRKERAERLEVSEPVPTETQTVPPLDLREKQLKVEITERSADNTTLPLEKPNPQQSTTSQEPTQEPPRPSETAEKYQPPSRMENDTKKSNSLIEPPRAATESSHMSGAELEAYVVRVGTFETREQAEDVAGELRKIGYPPEVVPAQVEHRTLYRVQLGRYKSEEAESVAKRLSEHGFSAVVIPVD